MTTIAYDHKNKMIAVDGRTTTSRWIVREDAVKWTENEKGLFFLSGAASDCESFASIFEVGKQVDGMDCSGFLACNSECFNVGVGGDGRCYKVKLEFNFAKGSGDDFALAAMDFKCTALEAIQYAATRDNCTGGKITVFDVENMEFLTC